MTGSKKKELDPVSPAGQLIGDMVINQALEEFEPEQLQLGQLVGTVHPCPDLEDSETCKVVEIRETEVVIETVKRVRHTVPMTTIYITATAVDILNKHVTIL